MRRLLSCLLAALAAAAPVPAAAAPMTRDAVLTEYLWQRFRSLPPAERPKTAFVLSGGGARAMAHTGVLEVLEREGFDFDIVAGTSMGSMVGGLYASGLSAAQIRALAPGMALAKGEIVTATSMARLFFSDRLIDASGFEAFAKEHIGERTFDQLPRRFGTIATDLRSGERIVFRDGPVAPAVRASMNLPGLFAPVQYRHRFLVDGGVVDYVPVGLAKQMGAEWVLATVSDADLSDESFDNVFRTLEQVIDIRGKIITAENLRQADVVARPQTGHLSTFDFDKLEEAMTLGVAAGQAKVAEAQRSLALKALPRISREWRKP